MSRRLIVIVTSVLVFVLTCAGSFGLLAWKHTDDAREKPPLPTESAHDSPAAKLSDEELQIYLLMHL